MMKRERPLMVKGYVNFYPYRYDCSVKVVMNHHELFWLSPLKDPFDCLAHYALRTTGLRDEIYGLTESRLVGVGRDTMEE